MRHVLALLIVLLALPLSALAREQDHVQRLDRILPAIRASHPGRFYDAQGPYEGADGRLHYRLKWLTPDGRIIWFDADARTGAVIGQESGPAWQGPESERRYAPRRDWRDERGDRRDHRQDRGHDRGN